jgi:hypothetical protein
MFDSIRSYVRLTPGCEILIDDDPVARKVGFCTGANVPLGNQVSWCIGLINLKESVHKDGVTEETRKLLSESLSTIEGKTNLARTLMRDQSPV